MIHTKELGTILIPPNGLLRQNHKFHIFQIPMMVLSSLKILISIRLSSITKSITFMTTGLTHITKYWMMLEALSHLHLLYHQPKKYLFQLISMTSECTLHTAKWHIHLEPWRSYLEPQHCNHLTSMTKWDMGSSDLRVWLLEHTHFKLHPSGAQLMLRTILFKSMPNQLWQLRIVLERQVIQKFLSKSQALLLMTLYQKLLQLQPTQQLLPHQQHLLLLLLLLSKFLMLTCHLLKLWLILASSKWSMVDITKLRKDTTQMRNTTLNLVNSLMPTT